jgi:hypothetical protein
LAKEEIHMRTVLMGIALLSAGSSAFAQGSEISGFVIDEHGNPVVNTTVTYASVPNVARDAAGHMVVKGPQMNSAVRTAAQGAFTISSLVPGTYLLCASGVNANQLRSCEWTQLPTTVTLSAGQSVSGVNLRVRDGVLITFQVNDPSGHVQDLADFPIIDGRLPLYGGNFRLGIVVGTRYVPAQLISETSGTRQYEAAVPNGVAAKVMLGTTLSVQGVPATAIVVAGQTTIQLNVQ